MPVHEISPQQLQDLMEQELPHVLVDCREQQEYDIVRIEGARLVPMSEFGERMEELKEFKEQQVVVYCHHGMRSLRVADLLVNLGFSNVHSLAGGIDRWALEIQPSLPRY